MQRRFNVDTVLLWTLMSNAFDVDKYLSTLRRLIISYQPLKEDGKLLSNLFVSGPDIYQPKCAMVTNGKVFGVIM